MSPESDWEQLKANSEISNSQVLSTPFFRKPVPGQLGAQLFAPIADADYVKSVRDQLLALAFPSLTLVTGGESGENFKSKFGQQSFVDMNDPAKRDSWPSNRENTNWLHSDIKDVSFVFDRKVFDLIVDIGGLK